MSVPQYPIDLIAIRDEKLKMQGKVIKWWNVQFVDAINSEDEYTEEIPEEMVEEPAAEPELDADQLEAIARANDIFARLEAEKAADEAEKAAEIAAALAAQEDSNYNASTNSYSGAYGTGPVDEDTASQAASILNEKNDAMADLINSIQNEE